MTESDKQKPGFFSRLFGRGATTPETETKPEPAAEQATPAPVEESGTAPEPAQAPLEALIEPVPLAAAELIVPLEPGPPAPPTPAPPAPAPAPPPAPEPSPAPRASEPAPPPAPAEKKSWWRRLRDGLSRSSNAISRGITDIVLKRKLDATTLEELEDVLIQADLGVDVSTRIAAAIGKGRFDRQISPEEVHQVLAGEVEAILTPVAKPLEIDRSHKPFVLLMVGVNGSGKTTTIGKLAAKFSADGLKVTLAAGDTFRAAAIEQLKVWAERTHSPIVAREQGADSAGLAFDALKAAQENGSDVLLIDTAGRLQNKAQLMDELAKVVRVIRKIDASAPHAVLLVLDATVGQNAISQTEIFGKTAGVTGLVMTKLDGTARGGILVALAAKFGLPVHYIGVGEGIDDLEPFSARDFSRAIAGME
ncbi:signal recognition particle-docking protein FtsY [Labrys neptuniae]|uniref:signal recognition particle-docking protein FtsY n=1 Tax=Labrys neptuniae TaxID=376174 RepID=UPI002890B241|nr:signal recognition particle-docking protein FtsY [Labrys neptuniae]MDT3377992.1 signal recognition particle-docking protein FtsY [Labrys neptuniae]